MKLRFIDKSLGERGQSKASHSQPHRRGMPEDALYPFHPLNPHPFGFLLGFLQGQTGICGIFTVRCDRFFV